MVLGTFVFYILPAICNFSKWKKANNNIIQYFTDLPDGIYYMAGIGFLAPVTILAIQIWFIHRLEMGTHQSENPLRDGPSPDSEASISKKFVDNLPTKRLIEKVIDTLPSPL